MQDESKRKRGGATRGKVDHAARVHGAWSAVASVALALGCGGRVDETPEKQPPIGSQDAATIEADASDAQTIDAAQVIDASACTTGPLHCPCSSPDELRCFGPDLLRCVCSGATCVWERNSVQAGCNGDL